MPDWDDPDLEQTPYLPPNYRGNVVGQRRPRACNLPDLDAMHHRKRNALADYRELAGHGLDHAAIMRRLGLSDLEWRECAKYASRNGIDIPEMQHATNDGETWN